MDIDVIRGIFVMNVALLIAVLSLIVLHLIGQRDGSAAPRIRVVAVSDLEPLLKRMFGGAAHLAPGPTAPLRAGAGSAGPPRSSARPVSGHVLAATMVVGPPARASFADLSEPPISSAPVPVLPVTATIEHDADPTRVLAREELRAGPEVETKVLSAAEPRRAS